MSVPLGCSLVSGELFHPSTMLGTGGDGDVVGRASGVRQVVGGFRLLEEDVSYGGVEKKKTYELGRRRKGRRRGCQARCC